MGTQKDEQPMGTQKDKLIMTSAWDTRGSNTGHGSTEEATLGSTSFEPGQELDRGQKSVWDCQKVNSPCGSRAWAIAGHRAE